MPSPVYLSFAALALLALCPLGYAMWRVGTPRGRRDSALALHRAQLLELDRELAEGRMGAAEHAGARLEVQRRLLAVADTPDVVAPRSARLPLILVLILVPLSGAGLYWLGGRPDIPSGVGVEPGPVDKDARDAEKLIATLRGRLEDMDPATEMASRGYLLLGNAEMSRGRLPEAAAAWRAALQGGFTPGLAAQAAEAQFQVDGKMTDETRALFTRALDLAPPDAPWRALVQQRLGEAGK